VNESASATVSEDDTAFHRDTTEEAVTVALRAHRTRQRARRQGAFSLALAGGTVLAACGSGGSSPSGSGHTAGAVSKPGSAFHTAPVAGRGGVVVDARGRTVYVLSPDRHTNGTCSDANGCTALWPDLPLPDGSPGATAGAGIQASLLGSKKLSDGETYPTYNGWLMYEYAGDSGPGQAGGAGIQSFGGTWYTLSPAGTLMP